ncbi:MAG: DUF3185 family protein [Planctomycetota bacterium]|nr:MAG: DUF3185 family protein [Planctomycetota bacterium]
MLRIISFGLLGLGIVLIIVGLGAQDSIHSKLSEVFTGTPSDATVWYLAVGIAAAVAGAAGILIGTRRI